jgi:sporulation protein YlmC with PRC-barrel domain
LVGLNLLTGKKVIGVNGDELGEVKDVEFDMGKWTISDILVKLSDKAAVELGFKTHGGSIVGISRSKGSDTVYMPVELVSAVGDVITINKSLIEIAEGKLVKKYAG